MSDYVIGLTGGIACGKSHLSDVLRSAGANVIDADAISRGLTAENGKALPAIRAAFGDAVFQGNALDRRALGALVFADQEALKKLNGILHPTVFSEMRRQMDDCQGTVVLDVPLLYECGLNAWCDEVWCAYLPQKEQLKRLIARDGLSWREALRRIRAQMPTLEKARRADHVISTIGSMEESASAVLSLWRACPSNPNRDKGESL